MNTSTVNPFIFGNILKNVVSYMTETGPHSEHKKMADRTKHFEWKCALFRRKYFG